MRRPIGPGNDLPVDGDGDTAGALLDAEVGQQLDDRRAVALAGLAVEMDQEGTPTPGVGRTSVLPRPDGGRPTFVASEAAKRSGPKGWSTGSPVSSATTRSAVTGASSTPLR
jgi:hypothetical protein